MTLRTLITHVNIYFMKSRDEQYLKKQIENLFLKNRFFLDKLNQYICLTQAFRSRGRRNGRQPPPPLPLPKKSSLLTCPFLLMSPLNVVFLKEVTKNVDGNQQAKLRAS